MKRTNTFAVRPLTDDDEQVLRDLLGASAALWNEINYQRLMRYNDEDGFEGDVWDASYGFRNVPETAHREDSQADGTARAVRVGRPRLVGDATPSRKSQRTTHRAEYRPP